MADRCDARIVISVISRWEERLGPKPSREVLARICLEIEAGIRREGFRSHEEFAHAIALPKSTLSRLLSGDSDPRFSTLERIAFGLGMDLVDLLRPSSFEVREPPRTSGHQFRKDPIVVDFRVAFPPGEPLPLWMENLHRTNGAPSASKPRKRK